MLKKILIAITIATVSIGGVGVAQAAAKEKPEGSMMRPIDVRNCADSGVARGDRGHCVWILQVALERRPGTTFSVDTDGRYGPKTAAVVAAFNKAEGICDGEGNISKVAEEETFERLADELTPYPGVQKDNANFHADHV